MKFFQLSNCSPALSLWLTLYNPIFTSTSKNLETQHLRQQTSEYYQTLFTSHFLPSSLSSVFWLPKPYLRLDAFCMHRKPRWSWKHVHLIESAWQMWCSEIMNMQLTDVYAMYTHIVGTRDTDFLLWKTEGEMLSGAELRVFADLFYLR